MSNAATGPGARGIDRACLANLAIAGAGFALCVYAFEPGLMSIDSAVQYLQALSKDYGDQHPPLMAWLWGRLDRIVPGPLGMLLLHLALLWSGLLALAEGARRRGMPHEWALFVVGFLPTTLSIAGVIWKDVGMAFAYLCAVGLLYLAGTTGRASRFVLVGAALVLIAYATMIRANAAFAALPVAWYFVVVASGRRRLAVSLVAALALVGAILAAQQLLERHAFEARRQHLSQMILLFDLTAIGCAGGRADIPAAYRIDGFDPAALCENYDPNQVDKLFFFPDSQLRLSMDDAAFAELRRAWLAAVTAEPVRYLRHHNRAFAGLLGIRKASENDRLLRQPVTHSNAWRIAFEPNTLSRAVDATTDALGALGVFSGILWLVLAFALLQAARRFPGGAMPEIPLLASAIAYFLPYYLLSLAPNYRFVYWSVVATATAAVLLGLRALAARRRGQRSSALIST